MNDRIVGQPVYDADGTEVGTVKEVRGAYFKVDAPMQPDYWLSTASLQTTGGRLVVTTDAERYDSPDDLDGDRSTRAYTRDDTNRERHDDADRERLDREGEQTLKLREERLRVDKERERAGEVELGKRVVERTETVDVPVREERVVVERRPVNERATGAEIRDNDQTIEVPVERERVRAEKDTVVTEEVGVRKEVTERRQPVEATLRKEELVVEGEGDVIERDRNSNAPRPETYERERTRRD